MALKKDQKPSSYVDYMNDVFEGDLPNSVIQESELKLRKTSSNSKDSAYKEKWLEKRPSLNGCVIIRVNGVDFGINWKILAKFEPGLMSCDVTVREYWEGSTKIYGVSRNVSSFVAILDYFRTGDLHMPADVCPTVFKRELDFWRVSYRELSLCCLRKYANFHDNEQTLSQYDTTYPAEDKNLLTNQKSVSKWKRAQFFGWQVLTVPSSSIWAKVYLGVASFFVILSIFLLAASTNSYFLRELEPEEWEEFMSDEDLRYYYELIYKKPRPDSRMGSGGRSSSQFSGGHSEEAMVTATASPTTSLPNKGKRSISDDAYVGEDAAKDDVAQGSYERNNDLNFQFPDFDSAGIDTLANSEDVTETNTYFDDLSTTIQVDLNDIVNLFVSSLKRRMKYDKMNRVQINSKQQKDVDNDVDNSDGRAPRLLDINIFKDGENNNNNNHHHEDQGDNQGEENLKIIRRRRSASDNQSSPTTNSTSSVFNRSHCLVMKREDLVYAFDQMAQTAVAILSTDNSKSLPSAYTKNYWVILLERVCIIYFTLEFLIRVLFAPSKIHHLMSFFTIIDLIALAAMMTTVLVDILKPEEKYTDSVFDVINSFQVTRVFRLFRLVKDVVGFRVLLFSIKSSWKELILLVLYIVIAVTIFSSLIYYCEKSNMGSIPDAFWWAIVTMTTVGYGDMAPNTLWGKLIGVGCALSGVLLIAVTVPVFVNNFLLFYEHSKIAGYEEIERKKRKCLKSLSSTDTESTIDEKRENDKNRDEPMSREGSFGDYTGSNIKLRSAVSMSKVEPILISNKTKTDQGTEA